MLQHYIKNIAVKKQFILLQGLHGGSSSRLENLHSTTDNTGSGILPLMVNSMSLI